ncbi:ARM repeat-containing protein [Neoconidiobolus thromboides FSU 785]|nr:ARM repeat-containing protein [Neoconidiobolus thromboides FSU 785]
MGLIQEHEEGPFLELLTLLQCSDNEMRGKGESDILNIATTNPDALTMALIHVLRRLVVLPSPLEQQEPDRDPVRFSLLSPTTQEIVKNNLITALKTEEDSTCRLRLCDAVSDLYIYLETSERNWVELPIITLDLCNEASALLRESGFKIISSYPSIVSDSKMNAIGKAFNLTSPKDGSSVRLVVLKAFVALLIDAEKPRHDKLIPYLPEMFKVLEPIYINKDEDSLWAGLSCFVELAETKSYLLMKYLPNILKFCTIIMEDPNLDESPKHTALEFILTIVEGSSSKTRNYKEIAQILVPILLNWISSISNDKEWYTILNIDEYEEESNYQTGYDGLDRLACATGGKYLFPVALTFIIEYSRSEDWKQRYAAVLALSAIGEGCGKTMGREMGNIIQLILPHLHDSHPRVRYATSHTFGQLAADFPEEFAVEHHDKIIPPLFPLLDDFSNPRVQAHAAAALHNIAEALDKNVINVYLRPLLEKLFNTLKGGVPYVKEQSLTTIASIADVSEDNFLAYYSDIMPALVEVAEKAVESNFRTLRAKAIECISLVALVVGLERLRPDLGYIANLFVQLQSTITSNDDPLASYLLQAWTRMAMLLGKEFQPYLGCVIPDLIKSALAKPEIVILDKDDDPEEKYPEEQGWEFNDSYGRLVGVRTSLLEEKSGAIEMLLCFAQSLQSAFSDYAVSLLPEMTPLINYIIHSETRSAAIRSTPHLLFCLVDSDLDQDEILKYSKDIFKCLMRQLKTEDEPSIFNLLLSTFSEIMDIAGPQVLKSNDILRFSKEIIPHLNNSIKSLNQYALIAMKPDFDEEDLDYEYITGIRYDEEFINNLSKTFHDLVRIHGYQFFKELANITGIALQCLDCPSSILRRWALGVFDDVVEYGGEVATRFYGGAFVESTIKLLLDSAVEVRQAASYGVGLWAQFGGSEYNPCCASALPKLILAIQDPAARTPENIFATDNAVAALAKIITFKGDVISLDGVCGPFINALPIREDRTEFTIVYNTAVELLDNPPPSLQKDHVTLHKLVKALIVAISEELMEPYILKKALETLKKALKGNEETFKGYLQELVPANKTQLFNVLFE